MTEQEQLIADLRYLLRDVPEGSYKRETLNKAIAALEEQEAVKPTRKVNENGQILSCGNCGTWLIVQKQKYCHECGKAVKWDE